MRGRRYSLAGLVRSRSSSSAVELVPAVPATYELPPSRATAAERWTVPFAFGSTEPADDSGAIPTIAARLLADADLQADAVGHTDRAGPAEFNFLVGLQRARAIAERLKRLGVPGERVHVRSLGEAQPIDRAPTRDAERRNRRVEINLRRKP